MSGFEVRDVENLREHYVLTLRHWVRTWRTMRGRPVKSLTNPPTGHGDLYMAESAHFFETGQLNAYQSLLAKAKEEFGLCRRPETQYQKRRGVLPDRCR